MSTKSREIRLKSRPVGLPKASDFELAVVDLPDPGPGQALVRNTWMSVDPYMRGRMMDRESYVPPFQLGEALQGGAIGQVVKSNDPALKEGDLVNHFLGWRDYAVGPAVMFQKLPPLNAPSEAFLNVLGMTGLTAYAGLLRLIEPKPGETVFVSGAAGAVGAVVCQIAKIKGAIVVGSVGTDEKGRWLKNAGVDHVINYKTAGDLTAALRAAAPQGIDGYFDNVGGDHLEAAMEAAKPFARFAECGMIAQYNATEPPPGPRNMANIVGKRLKIQGFIVSDYVDMRPAFLKDMSEWIAAGKIKSEETIEAGLENAPKAFINLFSGANTGKMLVKLS